MLFYSKKYFLLWDKSVFQRDIKSELSGFNFYSQIQMLKFFNKGGNTTTEGNTANLN